MALNTKYETASYVNRYKTCNIEGKLKTHRSW